MLANILSCLYVASDIVFLNAILPLWKFNLLIFDDEVDADDTACYLTAVPAVANVTSTLLAEEIIVVDLNGHSLAVTRSFHD